MKFTFEREYQLSVNHRKLSVIEWGEPDAEPLLCMHGWLDNAASFHYLAPLLKKHYRLIALEMPGHGQSEHLSADAEYQFMAGIATIDGALDVLKLDSCKIIGHSMGGALSLLYAGVMPHRVEKLVSIDALGPWTIEVKDTAKQLAQAIEHRKNIRRNKRFFNSIEQAAEARATVSELTAEQLLPLIERGVVLTEQGYQWSSDARLKQASWLRMTDLQLKYILQQVEAKFLLIQAKQGIINSLPITERLALLSNQQAVRMDGGHHLHMEYPELVAQQIVNFLAD